jgi:RNA polymerase sigma factor (sigma-70 family)
VNSGDSPPALSTPWNQFPYPGVSVRKADPQRSEAPIEDADLIALARSGNESAVEELVRRYQDVAFRVACLITGDADEAQDASQTAFIKAFRSLGTFREGAPFRPWLLRIVGNEAKNRVRATARRATGPLDESIVAFDPSPEELAERNEQQRELLAAVRALTDDDQQIIGFRYFLGLSEPEMAELLDCPRGTVKSRLSRATARLRDELTTRSGGTSHV